MEAHGGLQLNGGEHAHEEDNDKEEDDNQDSDDPLREVSVERERRDESGLCVIASRSVLYSRSRARRGKATLDARGEAKWIVVKLGGGVQYVKQELTSTGGRYKRYS